MSGDGSGSHQARRRLAVSAELSPGLRRPAPGREERLDVPPDRPSDPPPSWRTIKMLVPAVLVLLSASGTAATLYATYSARLSAVESQTREVGQTLAVVESASRARDESLGARMMTVERDGAVRETEQRATTRALEALADEIRELRAVVQRTRR